MMERKFESWFAIVMIMIICILIGAGASYATFAPKPQAEGYAPQQIIASTVVAERVPDAKAKPKTEIPKGGKTNRIAKLTVQASPVANTQTGAVECPPIDVDLTLVDMPDATKRFAAAANGQIIKFIDVPVATAEIPHEYKWGVGASYNTKREAGVWVDHYAGPFVAGVGVRKSVSDDLVAEARLGFRF